MISLARCLVPLLVAAAGAASLTGCDGAKARRASPVSAPAPPFVEVAASSGVDFTHDVGGDLNKGLTIVQTTGAGCAILDFDNDGLNDLFLVQGHETPGNGHRLYRNTGGGQFEDVTRAAGIKGPGKAFGMGAAVGDYNGDGWTDLYVMCDGPNTLYRNNGNGTFTDVTQVAGVQAGGFSAAAAFADFDEDGDLDLYVARYCAFTPESRQRCQQKGTPTSCPPYYYNPTPDLYYRNRGDGRFEEVSKQSGIVDTSGRGLGVLAFDYNGDGHLDIFVANDGSPNFLFAGDGRGHFEEVGTVEAVGFSATGAAQANMGCDVADFKNDGTLSIVVGVFQNETNPLFHFRSGGGTEDLSRISRLADLTNGVLTFGIGFADMDNDGWRDVVSANGHVHNFAEKVEPGQTWKQPRQYLRNVNGSFQDATQSAGPAFTHPAVGRGLAFGDLDNDGDIDLLVSNCSGKAMVIRNENPPRHWLRLRLIAARPWGDAAGAEATLYAGDYRHRAVLKTAYSFASANEPVMHFGLGDRTAVDRIEIKWRDGTVQTLVNPEVDRLHVVRQEGAPPLPTRG